MRFVGAYTAVARWYDLVSLERPVYRSGRVWAIEAMRLSPGDRVLDVGCGTGLNLAPIQARIGPGGVVVGVDSSADMVAQARRRTERNGWSNVCLVTADATTVPASDLPRSSGQPFDAALATYALSLMPQWRSAWSLMCESVRPGGRLAVVDLGLPTGLGAPTRPLARLACALGRSRPERAPWRVVEQGLGDVHRQDLWAGHVLVRVGTLRGE